MVEIVEQIGVFFENLIRAIGYPGITFMLVLENFFPPTPSEVVMPFAGLLVARGELTFVGVWLAALTGAVLGSLGLYYVGTWADERVVRAFLRRYGRYMQLSEADLDKALVYFEKYGDAIVLTGRLMPLPLVRALIAVVAGIHHMRPLRFVVFTAIGAGLWIAGWLTAGVLLGENWDEMLAFLGEYEEYVWVAGVAVIALGVAWLALRWRRRSAKFTENP
jgi:membrane protein DedA with SNARE-associated domain